MNTWNKTSPNGHQPGTPVGYKTYIHAFRSQVEKRPDAEALIFLENGDEASARVTYQQLDDRAQAIAGALQACAPAGERVLLQLAPGPDFVAGFLASLYAGTIAVPTPQASSDRNLERVSAIANDCTPAIVLADQGFMSKHAGNLQRDPVAGKATWLNINAIDSVSPSSVTHFEAISDGTAFLQYTSGSTSDPKGVKVTNENLVANMEQIAEAFGHSANTPMLSWLPMYHDMGLIGGLLQPLFTGTFTVLMPPMKFVQKPIRWLRAISRFRPHTSGAPNFAYDLCISRTQPAERVGLDLSSWKAAFNGAEPVRAETLENFAAAYAEFGFRAESHYPNYGLAEATLIATGGSKRELPVVRKFIADELDRGQATPLPPLQGNQYGAANTRVLVSSGRTVKHQEIRIVDPDFQTTHPEGEVGEIWLRGPNIARGYWNKTDQTYQTFRGRLADTPQENRTSEQDDIEATTRGVAEYLRTGDLGFLLDGELFVTGRRKDLIIHYGRNIYPQDIEAAAACHPAFPRGAAAAFNVADDAADGIALVQQIDRRYMDLTSQELDKLAEQIWEAVWLAEEIPLKTISLVRPNGIKKTSSGKIMRRAILQAFQENELPEVHRYSQNSPLTDEASSEAMVMKNSGRSSGAKISGRKNTGLKSGNIGRQSVLLQNLRKFISESLELPLTNLVPEMSLHKIGLDSLEATLLAHRVETAFGAPIPPSAFLRGMTLGDLASNLAASGARTVALPENSTLQQANVQTAATKDAALSPMPLSRGQEALYFIQKMEPTSSTYNVNATMHLHSWIHGEIVRDALRDLCKRHPLLRSKIYLNRGRPYFRFLDDPAPPLNTIELVDADRASVMEAVEHECHEPMQIEEERLFRATLFRHSEGSTLLLTYHHLICDGISVDLAFQELDMLVSARAENRKISLPAPGNVSRHLGFEEKALSGVGGYETLQYWLHKLEGAPTQLLLPFAKSNSTKPQSQLGASCQFTLSPLIIEKLHGLAKQASVTPFAILQTAFQILIGRYTGMSDFLIGSVSSIRQSAEQEHAVGYLVNPIVLRANIQNDSSFLKNLENVRDVLGEALDHQLMPFNMLVEQINPERRSERTPLVQITCGYTRLSYTKDKAATSEADGLAYLTPVFQAQQEEAYDLGLQFFEIDGEIQGHLTFNTAVYAEENIVRMADHFRVLLENALDQPDAAIDRLELLPEREAAWLKQRYSLSAIPPLAEEEIYRPIHDLVSDQMRKTPDAAAVEKGAERLSYRELDQRAERIAQQLLREGIKRGDIVGLLSRHDFTLPEACLGIMKIGAAYTPLSPDHPTDRNNYIISDCAIKVVLALGDAEKELTGSLNAKIITPSPEIIAGQKLMADAAIDLTDIAYVIYTSGSTGQPKGVSVPHGAIVRRLLWKCSLMGITTNFRVLQSISPGFDPSVWELFSPLINGGCVVMAPPDIQRSLSLFVKTLMSSEISAFSCVPSFLKPLIDHPEFSQCTALKHVICGGEPLNGEVARQFNKVSNARLHHFYGPTEAAIFATHFECRGELADGRLPIGRPVENTTIRVVTDAGHPAPIGTPGELYIGGQCLATGYINDEQRTANSFIRDPLGLEPKALFYRTGDLVRFESDGELVFLGRRDEQIKLRGFRIEPVEIESALESIKGVLQAAITVKPTEDGSGILIGHIACAKDAPDDTTVRAELVKSLPRHMIPTVFVRSDALPLSSSGKVDRTALPEPEIQLVAVDLDNPPPRTETETKLALIWQELLDAPSIGVRSNFFDLGGHSLLALQLLTRIEEEFSVRLPAMTVFEKPTLAALGTAIETTSTPAYRHRFDNTPKFFCIAPGHGDEIRFAGLQSALGTTHEMETLVPPNFTAQQWRYLTVDELAERYAAEIIAAQSDGPYIIGGFSVSGLIALKTAKLLTRTGNKVAQVILIDSVMPLFPNISGWAYFKLKNLFSSLSNGAARLVGGKLFQVMQDRGLEAQVAATFRYKPTPYDGKTLLIVSQGNNRAYKILFSGWWKTLPNLETHRSITGWHGTMFREPGVHQLAEVIRHVLDEKRD